MKTTTGAGGCRIMFLENHRSTTRQAGEDRDPITVRRVPVVGSDTLIVVVTSGTSWSWPSCYTVHDRRPTDPAHGRQHDGHNQNSERALEPDGQQRCDVRAHQNLFFYDQDRGGEYLGY